MTPEMMICIPGPWKDRTEFLQKVVVHTRGEFMFAGGILTNPKAKDHVPLEFCEPYDEMRRAFEIAGQGKLPANVLDQIATHSSVVYIRFPLDVLAQRDRLLKFTTLLRDIGGFAVKVESTGVAHVWDEWQSLLSSANHFDQYRGFVVLISGVGHFYSCGMHHFGLPDCQISRQVAIPVAADTMNRLNYYQVIERPTMASGHTFSVSAESPRYRLTLINDDRHPQGDLFRNPNGLWDMKKLEPAHAGQATGADGRR